MPNVGKNCPVIQLGAENNIEKSRCLAQTRKKISARCADHAGFSGFRVDGTPLAPCNDVSFTVISGM
jgi:hypothetical protein